MIAISPFGAHTCGNLTHYRRWDGFWFSPCCFDCGHGWEEKPLSGSEVADKKYDDELGIYQSFMDVGYNPDMHSYREYDIDNTCGYGCKIYINEVTGKKVLAHNSNYGCRKV
jgi:isopentenyldiphosphate isomerase